MTPWLSQPVHEGQNNDGRLHCNRRSCEGLSRDGIFEAFQVGGLFGTHVLFQWLTTYLFGRHVELFIFRGYKLYNTHISSRDENMMKTFMFHGVGVHV